MARKIPHLVCQQLENISRRVLEKYPQLIRAHVRRRHGVYALYRKNRLCYVGLASNLRSRLRHHLRDRHSKTWDHFSVYFTVGDSHLRELEALVIRIASPGENRQRGRLAKSEDLKPVLRRQIGEFLRLEEASLFGASKQKLRTVAQKIVEKEGRRATLAEYVTSPFRIRLRYKGRLYKARVRRDGKIRLRGKLYTSPSKAAEAIVHHGVDGWYVWRYERAPGDWVKLDELRK